MWDNIKMHVRLTIKHINLFIFIINKKNEITITSNVLHTVFSYSCHNFKRFPWMLQLIHEQ